MHISSKYEPFFSGVITQIRQGAVKALDIDTKIKIQFLNIDITTSKANYHLRIHPMRVLYSTDDELKAFILERAPEILS